MAPPILHHYPMSPFAEKVRLILGAKGLAWQSVFIPSVMPKPDVIALTGGYRKTPLLQIGADVYCDTALIARVLESLQPQATLFPASAPLAPLLAQWADSTLFWLAVTVAMQPAGAARILGQPSPEVVKAFRTDRAAFTAGMPRPTLADALVQFGAAVQALDAQLASGGPFLMGAERSIADFSVAHGLWFVRQGGPEVSQALDACSALSRWLDGMLAIGHGRSHKLSSTEALAVAAEASARGAHAPVSVLPGLGFEAGQTVTVAATDYGSDPVTGILVGLSTDEVVVRRQDPRAGQVHVHFPRAGFQIRKEQTA